MKQPGEIKIHFQQIKADSFLYPTFFERSAFKKNVNSIEILWLYVTMLLPNFELQKNNVSWALKHEFLIIHKERIICNRQMIIKPLQTFFHYKRLTHEYGVICTDRYGPTIVRHLFNTAQYRLSFMRFSHYFFN